VPRELVSSAESQFESELSTADERRRDASREVGDRTSSAVPVGKAEDKPAAALRG